MQVRALEAATGIEQVYRALQALAEATRPRRRRAVTLVVGPWRAGRSRFFVRGSEIRRLGGPMSDNYLVISSDCHAGPPPEKYRGYMDPQYRAQYDEFLSGLSAMRDLQRAHINNAQEQFRTKFLAKTGDGGIQACWDPEMRDKELDGDGVAGEVIFPDADVLGIGGISSSPFGT